MLLCYHNILYCPEWRRRSYFSSSCLESKCCQGSCGFRNCYILLKSCTCSCSSYPKSQLKAKWEEYKKLLEKARNDAEKKYDEINEQNKILHSHLEALHIWKAKKEHNAAGISFGSSSADTFGDAGLQTVMTCLQNSKEIVNTCHVLQICFACIFVYSF
ncbi:hypothetical protein HN51_015848 [Arachis hypogaea]|nr:Nuclear-pore anchor [Arachis hypogaea]QHO58531.1 Nuclear-pore anchor [Arachis hypogaea]